MIILRWIHVGFILYLIIDDENSRVSNRKKNNARINYVVQREKCRQKDTAVTDT